MKKTNKNVIILKKCLEALEYKDLVSGVFRLVVKLALFKVDCVEQLRLQNRYGTVR